MTAADLLPVPSGAITEAGLRMNIDVGIGYIEAWLRGIGCVPLLQPDGGRRDRRDLARPGLAVAEAPAPSSMTAARIDRALVERIIAEERNRRRGQGRFPPLR